MKYFLLYPRKTQEQSAVFWNMMSSGLNSIISIILLWFVTRINGTADAGIFSLGYSTAQMMLTIGNYGMRNYQTTDVDNHYSFGTYFTSRIVTSAGMLVITAMFILYKGYYIEKALVVFSLCALKATDAIDDLFGGHFQKNNRLDISGKLMFMRVLIYTLAFIITLIFSKDLILSITVSIVVALCVMLWMLSSTRTLFQLEPPSMNIRALSRLLVECLPLCLGAFLLIYLGNVPKYAIDSYLSNEMQAYYTYLFMPCFVINLFVGFVLQPMLVRLTLLWHEKNYRLFLKKCCIIHGITLALSVLIIFAGRYLGCHLLSIIFGVDLMAYSDVLTLLLVGGGFFAFAVIDQIILTIMRHQYSMLIGFGISSIAATVIAPTMVRDKGLLGASYTYLLSAGLLFLIFLILIVIYYIRTWTNSTADTN